MKKMAVAAILLLGISTTAHAQEQTSSLGIKASTLGIGIEAERSFSDSFGARLLLSYFPYDYSGNEDDINYEFDLKLLSAAALADWHPFNGGFRVSGGIVLNGNKLDGEAKPTTTYDIGNTTYTAAEVGTLKGKIDFNSVAPYVGLGWDTSFGKESKIGFTFDLGAMYQGSPKAHLSANGTAANDPAFQNNLALEEDNLQHDLDNFKFFPVVSIGLNYRF